MSTSVDLFDDPPTELSSSPPSSPILSKRKSLKPKRKSYQECKRATLLVRTKKKNPNSQRKTRSGTVARREIRYYQNESGLLMPKMPFRRSVRDIAAEVATLGSNVRFTSEALDALQTAAEAYIVQILEIGNRLAVHDKRTTVLPRDLALSAAIDAHYTNIFHSRHVPRTASVYKIPTKSQSAPPSHDIANIQTGKTSLNDASPASSISEECQQSQSLALDEKDGNA